MNKFFQRPTGKENLTPRGWYDKWHSYMYGDVLAKQGIRYKNVFLDDFKKIKKKSKVKRFVIPNYTFIRFFLVPLLGHNRDTWRLLQSHQIVQPLSCLFVFLPYSNRYSKLQFLERFIAKYVAKIKKAAPRFELGFLF